MIMRCVVRSWCVVVLVGLLASVAGASTTVKISPADFPGIGTIPVDTSIAENQFAKYLDTFFDKNRLVFPSGIAMVNTLGYPIGKSYIGQFPSFEIGAAAGLGVYQRHRQDDYTDTNPTMPGGGANGAFHIGTGITDDLDILIKFFSLNWVYRVDETFENQGDTTQFIFYAKDINFYSFGAKLRYNLIDPMPLVPFVLKFGGVTIGCALDYFRMTANTSMDISDTRTISITGIGDVSATANYSSDITFTADMVSVTPEIFVYADLFYFLSLYTGPSVSFNWGQLNFKMDGAGNIVNTKAETLGAVTIPAGSQLATMTVVSEYKMGPYFVIPKWVVGAEFNFWVLKLQAEVSMALTGTNTDIADSMMAQVGVRFHFQGDKEPKRSDDDYEERVKKRDERKKKEKRPLDRNRKYEFIEDYIH